nr:uncharacterized protein LOC110607994 [Ipomoea batatas]
MATRNDDVWAGKLKRVVSGGEIVDTDQESVGSMEEIESPRSVAPKARKWNVDDNYKNNIDDVVYIHSQILRIRAEDSHIGEDTAEIFSLKDKVVSAVFLIRPILPASPLGAHTTITT